jgi:hypothetical protein
MTFDASWPLSHKTRLFLNSLGFGVGGVLFLVSFSCLTLMQLRALCFAFCSPLWHVVM